MPFGELLEQHRIHAEMVTLHRERLTSNQLSGVVRQFSRQLILIERVSEAGLAEGFAMIRRADLTRIDRNTNSLRRSLRAFGTVSKTHPMAREIDLGEWRTAITSAMSASPGLKLHREGVGDPFVFRSASIRLSKHLVIGERSESADPDEGEFALAIDHLSRLDLM